MKSVAFYCVFLFGSMCGTVSDPVASNLHIASSSLHETRAGLLASCFFPGAFLFADGICGYPNGWYLNGNACLACSAGTYSLETNMNNCIAFASARTICALSYPSALSIALHFSTPPKVVGSKLIAAGGEVDLIYYAAADLLDLESGVWSTSSLSLARDNYGVAALLDNFFVAAGGESDRFTFTASADVLNVKSMTWTTFPNAFSVSRSNDASVSYGPLALFAMGSDSNQIYYAQADMFNATSFSWIQNIASMSEAKMGGAGATVGEFGYFLGGMTQNTDLTAVVERYSFSTGVFSILSGLLSIPRWLCVPVVVGSILFCGGGDDDSYPSSVVGVYDTLLNLWSSSSLSFARSSFAGAAIGSKAIWAGGIGLRNAGGSIIDIYDLATKTWSTSALPLGLGNLAGASLGSSLILVGGSSAQSIAVASVELISFCPIPGSGLSPLGVCECAIGNFLVNTTNCVACPAGLTLSTINSSNCSVSLNSAASVSESTNYGLILAVCGGVVLMIVTAYFVYRSKLMCFATSNTEIPPELVRLRINDSI